MSAFAAALQEMEDLRATVAQLAGRVEHLERELAESRRPADLLTVAEFCVAFPGWSEGQLRWLIHHKTKSGVASALHQPAGPGTKLRIDHREWFRVLEARKALKADGTLRRGRWRG